MILTLTAAGIAICAALSSPCDGPSNVAVALRPAIQDASPDWSARFDTIEYCLAKYNCVMVQGLDCVLFADFTQSDGRTGKTFLCRYVRQMAGDKAKGGAS